MPLWNLDCTSDCHAFGTTVTNQDRIQGWLLQNLQTFLTFKSLSYKFLFTCTSSSLGLGSWLWDQRANLLHPSLCIKCCMASGLCLTLNPAQLQPPELHLWLHPAARARTVSDMRQEGPDFMLWDWTSLPFWPRSEGSCFLAQVIFLSCYLLLI